jgi:hypothetical protein
MQHAKGMRHIFICGLPVSAVFPRYLIKGIIKKKEKLLNMKRVL